MSYNPTRSWAIPDTEITLPNDNGHFLYLKVPTAEGATDAQILVDEDHIDPLRDTGYIIYKQGYIQPKRNGRRTASMLWGNVTQPMSETDRNYRHNQVAPSRVWNVEHHLGKYPSVTIMDTAGMEYEAEVQHTDQNNILITFSDPFAGYADIN